MDRLRTLAVPLSLIAIALVPAAPAAAAGESDVVVMLSDGTPDRREWVSQDVPRRYRAAEGDRVTLSGNTEWLTVRAADDDGSFILLFRPPDGERLRPGRYPGVDRSPASGRAALDISGEGRGCSRTDGHFEVRDLVVDPDGSIRRFWATYEQHCDGAVEALFGEVRVGMPAPGAGLATAPTTVRFPATDAGRTSGTVPVWVTGAGAGAGGRVAGVALRGADAGRFTIAGDGCTGAAPSGAGACEVLVRFPADGPGTRRAALRVTGADGAVHDVPLEAHAWGGRTRVVLDSEAGETIGAGRTWSHGAADGDAMILRGDASHVRMLLQDDPEGRGWVGRFAAPDGERLRPGRYVVAGAYPFVIGGPSLSVSGGGSACSDTNGEFTVNELTFDERGAPRTASVDFVQRCGVATAALRGTFEFRAGDTTPLAPWMTPGPPTAPLPPASEPDPAPSGPTPPAAAPPAPADASEPVPARAAAPTGTPASPPAAAALPARARAPRATPAVALAARAARASLARRGLAVAVSRLAPGARVVVALRRGTRSLARAAATAGAGGAVRLRVRASRAALGRAGAVDVVVTVRTPGAPGVRVVRRVSVSG